MCPLQVFSVLAKSGCIFRKKSVKSLPFRGECVSLHPLSGGAPGRSEERAIFESLTDKQRISSTRDTSKKRNVNSPGFGPGRRKKDVLAKEHRRKSGKRFYNEEFDPGSG